MIVVGDNQAQIQKETMLHGALHVDISNNTTNTIQVHSECSLSTTLPSIPITRILNCNC